MYKLLLPIFFLFFLSEIFASTQDGIERIKNLRFDELEITGVEIVEKGREFKNGYGYVKANADTILVTAAAKTPSKVKIAVALPLAKNWNGLFLGNGNGGIGKTLSPAYAIGGANGGYASAHCNLGTDKWWENQANLDTIVADFGYRAVYMMTIAGKKIAAAFYGKFPRYSYYKGGSTGGQEGLSMAERYPEEYDGIALMFPVSNRTRLHIRFAFEKSLLNAKQYFNNDEISKITAAIVAQNRDNAGEPQDSRLPYLKYPERAKVDYTKLDFLSPEQIAVLKLVHKNFHDPKNGDFVTFGLPPSCEIADGGKSLKKGFGCWMIEWFFGGKIDIAKVDLHSYVGDFEKRFAAQTNALPNLEKFAARGGKLLILQGKIDTIVPAEYIKEYYLQLTQNIGSVEKAQNFARLFLIAGGWHGNISNIDMLGKIRKWVEKNEAPDNICANVNINGKSYREYAQLFPLKN